MYQLTLDTLQLFVLCILTNSSFLKWSPSAANKASLTKGKYLEYS